MKIEQIPEKTLIYRRVSTDKQDDSLELQESRTLDYAVFKKFATNEQSIVSDPDTSGGIPMLERTGGRILMHRLKSGEFKHLIVAKLDRIGRDVIDGIGVLRFCNQNGITLHIVDLGGETITTQGHIGRLILTIMFAVAEWERAEIKDRTCKQMKALFDQGKLTGNVPYGWDVVYLFLDKFTHIAAESLRFAPARVRHINEDGIKPWITAPADPIALDLMQAHGRLISKTLVDNPAEQDVIRYIARAVQSGCKREHVAMELNMRGFKTKLGRQWQIGHVTSVLNNRHSRRLLQQTTPPSVTLSAPGAAG